MDLVREDPRPVIRGTAAWAIGKIGGDEAYLALKLAKSEEQDQEVLQEIEKGLQMQDK